MRNKSLLNVLLTIFLIISLAFTNNQIKPSKNRKTNRKSNDSKVSSEQCGNPLSKEYLQKFSVSECDMVSEGSICLFDGERVLLPNAAPSGCLGYWNFDDIRPLDSSGNNNHALRKVDAGPAFGGLGASAFFNGGEYLEVGFDKAFLTTDYTITFFFYLVEDSFSTKEGSRYCPLIQRGIDDLYAKNFNRAPGIYLDRKEKYIKTYIKTLDASMNQGEVLSSNARVSSQKWYHFALRKEKGEVKLYVNGILDAKMSLKASAQQNNGSLFIGGSPWLKDQCSYPFLIDELRYYNIALNEDYIQAEASPVLGSIEPSFIQLGCINCNLKQAAVSCLEGYHVCTSVELHTGGYQVARNMGWLNWNTHIWSHSAIKNVKDFDKLTGLSLCCSDLK
jgi:hypothetical protein